MREVALSPIVVEVVEVEVDVDVDEDVVGADVVVESADSLGLQAATRATSIASVTSLATVVSIGGSLRTG